MNGLLGLQDKSEFPSCSFLPILTMIYNYENDLSYYTVNLCPNGEMTFFTCGNDNGCFKSSSVSVCNKICQDEMKSFEEFYLEAQKDPSYNISYARLGTCEDACDSLYSY